MKIKYSKTKIHNFESIKKPLKFTPTGKSGAPSGSYSKNSSISYLFYFFFIVLAFIGASLIVRFIFLYKGGTFTTSSYSIYVRTEKSFVISLDKNVSKYSILFVPTIVGDRTKVSTSLGVPIDGEVKANGITPENFASFNTILSEITRPWDFTFQGMNVLDSIRFKIALHSVDDRNVLASSLKLSQDKEVLGVSQDEIYNAFKDSVVVDEQKSIEIINGTDVTGLAGDVGQTIKNVGGNVVSIKSGNEQDKSFLYATTSSETVSRISKIVGVKPTIKENLSSIADIQIVLGSDFGNRIAK